MRPLGRLLFVALAGCLFGCGGGDLSGVLVVIDTAPEAPRPSEVRLTWIDDEDRLLLQDRPVLSRIPETGERLGTVFVETSPRDKGERRIVVLGVAGGSVVSHGLGRARLVPGTRVSVPVRLVPGVPVDQDGDQIPDELQRPGEGFDAGSSGSEVASPLPLDGGVRADVEPGRDVGIVDRSGPMIDAAPGRDVSVPLDGAADVSADGPGGVTLDGPADVTPDGSEGVLLDGPAVDAPLGPPDVSADVDSPDLPTPMIDTAPPPVDPAPLFAVGSFVELAAAGTQIVPHSLGTTPAAVLVWTNSLTSEDFAADVRFGMGFGVVSNGVVRERSVATFHRAGAANSNSSRRMSRNLISLVGLNETLGATGNLKALGSSSFTVDWSRTGGGSMTVHYLLVGGAGVSAEVLDWTIPITGRRSVGTSFKPDALVHLWSGTSFDGLGTTNSQGHFGLGVMTESGQWALDIESVSSATPSETYRSQRKDVGVNMQTAANVRRRARFVSFEATSFNVEGLEGSDTQATPVITLALKGVEVKADAFDKATAAAPARQAVTSVGFQPGALLLTGVQDVAANTTSPHANFAVGATDGRKRVASAFSDVSGVAPRGAAVDRAGRAFLKVNEGDRVIDAEADFTSFDPNGFSLNWLTNDGVATQIFYLAFGRPRP